MNDAAGGRGLRTLVLGGARSGKSAYAEQIAGRAGTVRYIATAVPDPADTDFADRIAAHRVRRPGTWQVVEGDPVTVLGDPAPVTLIDDLGTWLTARIDARAAWESPRGTVAPDTDALVAAVSGYSGRLLIVSPELGLGVVPATASGRLFRDEIGTLNQRLAAICDEVVLVVAGVPVVLQSAGAADTPGAAISGAAYAATTGTPDAVAAAGLAAAGVGTAPVTKTGTPADAVADAAGAGAEATALAARATTANAADSPRAGAAASDTAVPAGERANESAAPVTGASADGAGAGGGAPTAATDATGSAVIAGADELATDEFAWVARSGDSTPVFAAVAAPDAMVRADAERRQTQLTKPAASLGRLETLGNWVAACQGQCPPKQFEQARVVVFAADHAVARHGVSAYPSEVTAQMVANFLAGGAAVNALARLSGATVRVVDLAVESDTEPAVSAYKIRRANGSIDREDALTERELRAALAAGRAIADEEIDSGADLLIAGDMGIGNTTPATVLIATLTDTEPVVAVGRGSGVDDAGWMRKASAVRDAMWRARPHRQNPFSLLRMVGGADFAATAGYLAQAAARRTPVILDGAPVTAAALIADMLAPGAHRWWVAGHRSTEPAHSRALERLGLEPLVELDMRLGEGSGAVSALPLLRSAIAALSEMATFDEAGVSNAAAGPAVATSEVRS